MLPVGRHKTFHNIFCEACQEIVWKPKVDFLMRNSANFYECLHINMYEAHALEVNILTLVISLRARTPGLFP